MCVMRASGGGSRPHVIQKRLHGRRRAFHFRNHTVWAVLHKTGQAVLHGQAVNKGTEAHPLHNAGKMMTDSFIIHVPVFLNPSICSLSQSDQAASPAPLLQDTSKIFKSLFNARGIASGFVKIKIDVREQVDLIDEQRRRFLEHQRIFCGFVCALGRGKQHDLHVLADFEFGRTDQIADIFDNEQINWY